MFLIILGLIAIALLAQRQYALWVRRVTCRNCGSRRTRAFCARCGTPHSADPRLSRG